MAGHGLPSAVLKRIQNRLNESKTTPPESTNDPRRRTAVPGVVPFMHPRFVIHARPNPRRGSTRIAVRETNGMFA